MSENIQLDHSPGVIRRLIYIIGDSIGRGVFLDSQTKRYRIRQEALVDAASLGDTVEVVNRSHFGYTIARGRQQIEKLLARGERPAQMLLEYGGNDCDFDWGAIAADPTGEHLPNTPLNSFQMQYGQLIDRLRQVGIQPIILNLPPIDPLRYFRTIVGRGHDGNAIREWLGDIARIYRFQELYSNAVERISRAFQVPLVDVRQDFLAARDFPDLIGEDGIHPTERGYRMMGERVGSFLRELLETGSDGPLYQPLA
ncbi:MAG: SGNH/GDSL hydrolase family protein [Bacillota bacterium]|nr:SGNH/GDSL hydrolase family protein [Bacillota bacterium]